MLRNPTKGRLGLALVSVLGAVLTAAQQSPVQPKPASLLATARLQLDHGDLESGEQTLWNILSLEPSNEQALTMMAAVRTRQQRYAEAEALYRHVLQLDPKSLAASRGLTGTLLSQEKVEDAIRQEQHTIDLAPQDSGLRVEIAGLYLSRGEFSNALSALNGIKAIHFPAAAIPLKAASLLGMERKAEAEALLPTVKGSPAAALELAEVFVEGNDPKAALTAISFITPITKSTAGRVYYLKGRALGQERDLQSAAAAFGQSLKADPNSVRTMLAISEVYALQNKHAESFAMLERARVVNPKSVDVLRPLIVEAMHAGENDKALEAAQDLQKNSSELGDRYLVASVMIQQKQYLTASHILEDYVAQRPDDARAYLGLGMAYLNLLRYAQARQVLERSLQLKPDLAEAEYQLGVLFAQQGDRQPAIDHWEKAISLQPHHAQALFSLGTMYLESGELQKAQRAFQASITEDPNNMKAEYDLALVLNKLGNSNEANQHFERYRKMQDEEHRTSGNPPQEANQPQN